jgi:hypothetical protein
MEQVHPSLSGPAGVALPLAPLAHVQYAYYTWGRKWSSRVMYSPSMCTVQYMYVTWKPSQD